MKFKCDTCGKNFTLQKNLYRHMRNIHKLKFTKFTSPNGSSTKTSQYKCTLCNRAYIHKSTLGRHHRKFHKMTSIKASLKYMHKCVIFEPSNLAEYPLLEKLMPEDYIYKVNNLEHLGGGKFKAKFEIADCTSEIFFVWLSKLSPKSLVTYRVKSFTKSRGSKIVFNKVFRCVHNTFPRKVSNPHPMHTGCQATLSVKIEKCCEALLPAKNTMAESNEIMMSSKAIVTLHHYHNHTFRYPMILKNIKNKNYAEHKNETCVNQLQTNNNVSQMGRLMPSNPSFTLSNSCTLIKTVNRTSSVGTFETIDDNIILNESQHNSNAINNHIKNGLVENFNLELLEDYNDNISVNNEKTETSLYNYNTNELQKMLLDFDEANKKMMKQFKSNPKYFLSAIRAFSLTLKNNLTCDRSLLNALYSFGKNY